MANSTGGDGARYTMTELQRRRIELVYMSLRNHKAGARVCQVGSLMFLLLGPQNYQMCPIGVKRIGYVDITVVPNNEIRCLNIFYKYAYR